MELSQSDRRYTSDELAALANVPRRTLRYYIHLGLVDRPIGETRAAYYSWQHLRQLLEVRRLTEQGFSLERVRELISGAPAREPILASPRPGSVAVRSHIHLTEGMELVIDPERAHLGPEQLRRFAREVLSAYERTIAKNNDDTNNKEP